MPTIKNRQQLEEDYRNVKIKLKSYMTQNIRLRVGYKIYDKRLEKKDLKIAKLYNDMAKLKLAVERRRRGEKQARYIAKKRMGTVIEARRGTAQVVKKIAYLTKDLDWNKDISRVQVVEIILRTIVTYDRLIADGTITFNELAYLIVGSQIEVFDISDAEDKLGDLGRYKKRDFEKLVDAGMFKKVYRKRKWYISVDGKERLNEILTYIYENKLGTYRVLRKLIVEE